MVSDNKLNNWRAPVDNFVMSYGKAFEWSKENFESVRNSEVIAGNCNLNNYDGIFWMLGDESSDNETFSNEEQILVKQYLENGGVFTVSGSEIGYDLYSMGSETDKTFYNNYLKAQFIADSVASAFWVDRGLWDRFFLWAVIFSLGKHTQ